MLGDRNEKEYSYATRTWRNVTLVQAYYLYMDEVKVEALGTTLCFLYEFLAAVSPYSFHIAVLLFQYYHQDWLLLLKIYRNYYVTISLFRDGSLAFHGRQVFHETTTKSGVPEFPHVTWQSKNIIFTKLTCYCDVISCIVMSLWSPGA